MGTVRKLALSAITCRIFFHKKCFNVPIGCLGTLPDHGTNAVSQAIYGPKFKVSPLYLTHIIANTYCLLITTKLGKIEHNKSEKTKKLGEKNSSMCEYQL